ncbi:unnamed protein product, partial [Polarella glacialis]
TRCRGPSCLRRSLPIVALLLAACYRWEWLVEASSFAATPDVQVRAAPGSALAGRGSLLTRPRPAGPSPGVWGPRSVSRALGMEQAVLLTVRAGPLRTTMLCTMILALKMLYVSAMVGMYKFKTGSRPPEDAQLMKQYGAQEFGVMRGGSDPNDVAFLRRLTRSLANDMENLPMGLICTWGSLLCVSASSRPLLGEAHAALAAGFALSRCVFTIAYAQSAQPLRTISWAAGVFCQLGLAGLGCGAALGLL